MRYIVIALVAASAGMMRAADADPYAALSKVKVEHYAPFKDYSEGPTWRSGEVFFCGGALLRVDKDRKLTKYLDVGPAGTYLLANGHMIVASNKQPTPALLDVAPDGTASVLVEEFDGKKLQSLNDVTLDAAGNVYWTDPHNSGKNSPIGKVFRVTPEGKVELLADNLMFPNGLDVDPASKFLYVIESQSQKVLRYELPTVGQKLGKATVFYDLGGAGGDGCVFDAAGNLWVADFHRPDTKKGRITVLSAAGKLLGGFDVPAQVVSNICFGGANHDEVFMTTGTPGGVFHAKVGIKGFKGHPGKPMKVLRKLDVKVLDEPVGKQ
jgi:gluconolactonase